MSDVLAVCTDLFFQARIDSAVRAADRMVTFVTAAPALEGALPCRLALVDLDAALDPVAAIGALRRCTDAPIVAFGPHLDTDRRKAARAAGADRVLAKSKFVTELPHMLNDDSPADTADLQEFGRHLEHLGRLLQDPDTVRRLYLAPEPHMQTAEDAVVLQSTDYLPYVAVDLLRQRLQAIRDAGAP